MFGRSEVRYDQIAQLQRGVRTLDRLLSQLGGMASEGARDAVDKGRDSAAEAFGDVAERVKSGAGRIGSEAMRLGRRATEFGELSVDRLAKNVGVHPLMLVGIALGLGAIVGAARYRYALQHPTPRKRLARSRSNRKGHRK